MVQKNSINNKILIICGPTASGKTALAVECAKLLNSEVVSADSMYIYKSLNIGTAKPTEVEMQGIKHHLIDVITPFDNFTVNDYKNMAQPIIDKLISKGKIPIICGGTGFYINSILFDLSYGFGEGNLKLREKYNLLAQERGNEYVYNILKEYDPETAEKLHFNDLKRVIRALEILDNGVKKSDIKDELTPKYDYHAYTIAHSRETLYDRINKRVDIMFDNGLLDEMSALIENGITINNQCMQAIGYKEIFEYLNGQATLEQTKEKIKLNTRHYAKRQITFFKKFNVTFLQPDKVEILAKTIVEDILNDR
jgi:tRNA dimethylallyltransferase